MNQNPNLEALRRLNRETDPRQDLYLCADDDMVAKEIVRRASDAFTERFAEIVRQNLQRMKKPDSTD